jgi:hypothetical protein
LATSQAEGPCLPLLTAPLSSYDANADRSKITLDVSKMTKVKSQSRLRLCRSGLVVTPSEQPEVGVAAWEGKMQDEIRQRAMEIVGDLWPREARIAGKKALEKVSENPGRYETPRDGDPIDLATILGTLKDAIELVSSCLVLYQTVHHSGEARERAAAPVDVKLDEAVRKGLLSDEQRRILEKRLPEGV